ncbi:hypothetical protein HK098_002364 [Nowakowskiella sp. JEL0407]|nr:hypothetical protein HK098_002364 [Nowakowskiella sp. JEL0407]
MGISSRGIIERDLSADFIIVKLKPYWKRTAKAILYSMLIGGSSDIVHAVFKSGIPMYWDMNSSISNSMQSLSLSRYYTADPDHSISETAPNLNIELSPAFDTIEDALTEIGKGNFVIVVDNEDRENEGDLVLAAEDMTPEKMAFMIRYTSGVICVPAEGDRLDELELPLMVERNTESLRTAYTITVDYSIGTTTGISAYDRSLTVRKLADPKSTPNQFTRPGHVFPLRYAPGGVLKRVGHTEASVDFCKLAGKQPVAAISEIVLDDGRMARRDDLRVLAKRWGMKIVKISDLVKYRVEHGV